MRRTLLALPLAATFAVPASAHPHVFVDATAGFAFDEAGRLSGLRITWTYDAFTSLILFDTLSLDADGDGQLDDADRAAIVDGETDWPPEYDGDVHLDIGGTAVAMGRPRDGRAWMEADRISVSFDLPLAEPLDAPEGTRLRLYDPLYYYAYTVVGVEAAEGPCAPRLDPFVADEATAAVQAELAALTREQMPDEPGIGARFADEVTLSCG